MVRAEGFHKTYAAAEAPSTFRRESVEGRSDQRNEAAAMPFDAAGKLQLEEHDLHVAGLGAGLPHKICLLYTSDAADE